MCTIKIKSVFRIVVAVSAVLLLCYIVGKFDLLQEKPDMRLLAADFEVFGIVQGVFFRKHTAETAKKLGVRGWCMNTRDGTVKGQMEAEEGPFQQMREWLTRTGSPQSRIDRAVFSDPKEIKAFSFEKFDVRKY